ncbi:MAG: ribulose-phosphate 3-epimerase, partial [Dehalococcoidia bacterium]
MLLLDVSGGRQAEAFCDYVQFDIMDGRFVPSQSIKCEHIAALNTTLSWEAHLMVEKPEDYAADFMKAGARRITFHHEASPHPEKVIKLIKDLGLEAGLALNPETPVATVLPLVSEVASVLLLTVHPGFYGSPFIPEVLQKVAELRRVYPEIEIGVDGGIKEANIAQVARAGVDAICVGSAVFLKPQPAESYRHLSTLARE